MCVRGCGGSLGRFSYTVDVFGASWMAIMSSIREPTNHRVVTLAAVLLQAADYSSVVGRYHSNAVVIKKNGMAAESYIHHRGLWYFSPVNVYVPPPR